jgi:hypothetical protein
MMGCNVLVGPAVMDFYINPGEGSASSMTGNERGIFTKFYADNPYKVALIVSKDRNARALMWTCDDGMRVLDQIYGPKYQSIAVMHWAYYNNTYLLNTLPLKKGKELRVTMDIKDDKFPYVDNFQFGQINWNERKVILSLNYNKTTNVQLSSHEGLIYNFVNNKECNYNIK